MKTLLLSYLWISVAAMLCIIIARVVLLKRLYALKNDLVFEGSVGMEILSGFISSLFPFKLASKNKDPESETIVKKLNTLKNYYWWLGLAVILVLVVARIADF